MELRTILRWWCIVYVLAVTLGGSSYVLATVSRTAKKAGGSATASRDRFRGHLKLHYPDTVGEDDNCEEMQTEQLAQMLGGAYNTRYMSISAPDNRHSGGSSKKRGAEEDYLFAVDDTYTKELSDKPAWEMDFATYEVGDDTSGRMKRSADATEGEEQMETNRQQRSAGHGRDTGDSKRSWDCGMVIKWKDLGKDYFPRHIRTVECTKTQCFYGQFTCQPRSFTVQLLRRKGRCVRSGGHRNSTTTANDPRYRTGVEGLPKELRELWVWEERAVNFCCECSAPSSHGSHRRYYS